jgi:hypothetical protein
LVPWFQDERLTFGTLLERGQNIYYELSLYIDYRRLSTLLQSILQCVRLLVSCNVNFGLGPLAGRNLALEQNVNLTVGAALHLRQEKVCQHEAEETSTTPDVTALATEVGLLLYVSNSNDCRSRKSYIRVKHVAREENAGNVDHVVGSASNTSSQRPKTNRRGLSNDDP